MFIKYLFIRLFFVFFGIVLLGGCSGHDVTTKAYYQSKAFQNKVLIPGTYHRVLYRSFYKKYFNPWSSNPILIKAKQLAYDFDYFAAKPGFNEAKTKRKSVWYKTLKHSANLATFPNHQRRAITIKNTALRKLPTKKPHYEDIYNNANDHPIDLFQNSHLAANLPVLILHVTRNNDWAYVYAGYASGWVPIDDLAYVSDDFVKKFKNFKTFVSVVNEKTAVYSSRKHFEYYANIGMVFPTHKHSKNRYYVKIARSNKQRQAYLLEAYFEKQSAVKQPYLLTPKRVKLLSERLLDQPYGWGGLYENRDCSSLVRDLFIPFGIYLPRNSKSQAKKGGVYIDFEQLSPKEKEMFVIKNAVPYVTLLWLPGHIMLYVGVENGRAMVLHNLWGVRSKDLLKRKIVGKVLVSTLEPENMFESYDKKMTLLKRLEGMSVLVPRY
ncbi:MAG: SH3 domain-containing protein [bacterium]